MIKNLYFETFEGQAVLNLPVEVTAESIQLIIELLQIQLKAFPKRGENDATN